MAYGLRRQKNCIIFSNLTYNFYSSMPVQPLLPAQATAEIRRILREHGEVRYSRHAEYDSKAPRDWAHDVDDDEVDRCLRSGRVTKPAERDPKYDEWAYRVEFQYDKYQLVTVTAIFSARNEIRVITRFRRKTKYDRTKPKTKG
ncbi:MAG: hypothetical protein Q8O25_04715 [Sulfurisoma sp.]|nr:hypothetical protein [Sulfurisoma sp.]